jgi:hypothetical protein
VDGPRARAASQVHSFSQFGSNPLALGVGETASRRFTAVRSRRLFLEAMHRLVPEVTRDLTTDRACEATRKCAKAMDELRVTKQACELALSPMCGFDEYMEALDPYLTSPAHDAFGRASADMDTHIKRWQQRFHLRGPWLEEAAYATLWTAHFYREDGKTYEGPLLLGYRDVNVPLHEEEEVAPDPSESSLPGLKRHEIFPAALWIDNLRIHDLANGHDGPFGNYDPRKEKVEDEAKRLLPELDIRLRTLLEAVANMDVTYNDAPKTTTLRTTKKFEWLVRYQVMNQSKSKIANSEEEDRSHVGREVNATARLIGLDLRKEKGGRPRKIRGHIKRVS